MQNILDCAVGFYVYIHTRDYCRSPVDDSLRLPFKMEKWLFQKKQETQSGLFSKQAG